MNIELTMFKALAASGKTRTVNTVNAMGRQE